MTVQEQIYDFGEEVAIKVFDAENFKSGRNFFMHRAQHTCIAFCWLYSREAEIRRNKIGLIIVVSTVTEEKGGRCK